jgi:hypothetical protein
VLIAGPLGLIGLVRWSGRGKKRTLCGPLHMLYCCVLFLLRFILRLCRSYFLVAMLSSPVGASNGRGGGVYSCSPSGYYSIIIFSVHVQGCCGSQWAAPRDC